MNGPFHPGEIAVQERAGVRAGASKIGGSVVDSIAPPAAHFLAKRYTVTAKGGVDLTPYFNVEGFVRHARRKADNDPQDPNFLNTGLVEDAAGYGTTFEETLARVEGTLKLFDDRWIQSAKWTGARQDTTGMENFLPASESLVTSTTSTAIAATGITTSRTKNRARRPRKLTARA